MRKAKSAKACIGEAAEAAVMALPASVEDAAAAEGAPKKRAPRRKKPAAAADAALPENTAEVCHWSAAHMKAPAEPFYPGPDYIFPVTAAP